MSDQRREEFDFVLNFEQELITSISRSGDGQAMQGWSTDNTPDGWMVKVFLQSPDYHDGKMVAVKTPVPSRNADLGMDLQTYILIQASGATEKYVSSSPYASQRLSYVSRTE